MIFTSIRRTAVAVAAAAFLAACQDSSNPASPEVAPSFERSAQAQANQEAKFARSSPEVLDLPGTVFADNDERTGKLVFGVEHMGHVQAVKNKLKQLDIAESDYEVRLTPAIYNAATLRDRFRPTVAGIQINFTQYVCTLGFNVDHGAGRSFITNSHCTANQGGNDNTTYWQPVQSSSPEVIATEASDPVFSRNLGSCSKGKRCRYSDAARALYDAGTASTRGEIAQTTGVNNGSLNVNDASPIFSITAQNTTADQFSGAVNKVGRTTGWTRGNVTQTCANVNVSGTAYQLLCQSLVQDPGGAVVVSGGDSGSPVFTGTGNNVTLVGILWGGSSDNKLFVFSPLKNIVMELGSFNAVK